jgi:tRNA pseudouridine-54 N-methylase
MVLLLTSCGKPKCELIGTWYVSDVKIDSFDEKRTTPQMLEQAVEVEKQNKLKFVNDTSLLIITKDNVYDAIWELDTNYVIYYRFKNGKKMNKLADYKKPYIIMSSHDQYKHMITTYEKE